MAQWFADWGWLLALASFLVSMALAFFVSDWFLVCLVLSALVVVVSTFGGRSAQ